MRSLRATPSSFVTRHASAIDAGDLWRAVRRSRTAPTNPSLFASCADALVHYFENHCDGRPQVILPAYTCDRVVAAVTSAGKTPRFVDVDLNSGIADPRSVSAAMTDQVAAVVATHIYGNPPDTERLRALCDEWDCRLIEDAALAVVFGPPHLSGAPDSVVSSYGRGKSFALGAGGTLDLVLGSNDLVAGGAPANSLRDLARMTIYLQSPWVRQSRLSAALGVLRTNQPTMDRVITGAKASQVCQSVVATACTSDRLAADADHRKEISSLYRQHLPDHPSLRHLTLASQPIPSPGYALLAEDRDRLASMLKKAGCDVATAFSYSAGSLWTGETFDASEEIARRIIVLPNHRFVDRGTAGRITELISSSIP